jgi:hypothetical protein
MLSALEGPLSGQSCNRACCQNSSARPSGHPAVSYGRYASARSSSSVTCVSMFILTKFSNGTRQSLRPGAFHQQCEDCPSSFGSSQGAAPIKESRGQKEYHGAYMCGEQGADDAATGMKPEKSASQPPTDSPIRAPALRPVTCQKITACDTGSIQLSLVSERSLLGDAFLRGYLLRHLVVFLDGR